MKIIAIGKIKGNMEKINELMKPEATMAWNLYTKGVFREIYLSTEQVPRSVIVMECENVSEAKKIIQELPLVKNKVTEYDFIPVGPFGALASLFSTE